jgi:hypothetical protein
MYKGPQVTLRGFKGVSYGVTRAHNLHNRLGGRRGLDLLEISSKL